MPDREKTINGLKTCIGMTEMKGCEGCLYNDLAEENCQGVLMADALELIETSKPIEPERHCECGNGLYKWDRYCWQCGKKVEVYREAPEDEK